MSLLGFYDYFMHGRRAHLLQAALLPVGLYVILVALNFVSKYFCLRRRNYYHTLVFSEQFIRFSEVDHCHVQMLAERDWPVKIRIHSKCGVLAQLGLKAIQRADAA